MISAQTHIATVKTQDTLCHEIWILLFQILVQVCFSSLHFISIQFCFFYGTIAMICVQSKRIKECSGSHY